jgi:hypothetical protein
LLIELVYDGAEEGAEERAEEEVDEELEHGEVGAESVAVVDRFPAASTAATPSA